MNTMDCQDWTEVKVGRKASAPRVSAVPGTATKQHVASASGSAVKRQLESEETLKPKSKALSTESRQAIVQARVANKWSQQQLNTQCAFPKNLISDIEACRAQPTGAQLNVLRRVLSLDLKFA